MLILSTTRFNDETFQQNRRYIERNIPYVDTSATDTSETGLDKSFSKNATICQCIYGTPSKIKSDIEYDADLMVLEMNNSQNKIEGIGWIKNRLCLDHYYRIYNDGNYNRYIYKGKARIDRTEFEDNERILIEIMESLLFYGSRHIKRAKGITVVPQWIIKNNNYKYDFTNSFRNMFDRRNLCKKIVKITV